MDVGLPTRRRLRVAGWVVLAVAFAHIAGGFQPFTVPADLSTALGGLTILAAASRYSRPPTTGPGVRRRIAVVWGVWLAVATSWELAALSGQPRSSHPTFSSLINMLIDTHPSRSVAVLGWLGLGWWLSRK